jgi:hypothetical protein
MPLELKGTKKKKCWSSWQRRLFVQNGTKKNAEGFKKKRFWGSWQRRLFQNLCISTAKWLQVYISRCLYNYYRPPIFIPKFYQNLCISTAKWLQVYIFIIKIQNTVTLDIFITKTNKKNLHLIKKKIFTC